MNMITVLGDQKNKPWGPKYQSMGIRKTVHGDQNNSPYKLVWSMTMIRVHGDQNNRSPWRDSGHHRKMDSKGSKADT